MTARSASHRPRLTQEQVDRARRLSAVHPRSTVAAMLGVTPTTILHAERRGWKPAAQRLRPVSNDWGIIAPGRGVIELSSHYQTSMSVIARWFREKPVTRLRNGGTLWEPPANFAELLEQHPARRVSKMLGVHEATIKRARERLGIHPAQIAARRSIGWADRYAGRARDNQGGVATGLL